MKTYVDVPVTPVANQESSFADSVALAKARGEDIIDLYMIFYAVHIGLLYLMLWIYPIVWLMVLIGVVYIGLHIAAIILLNSDD